MSTNETNRSHAEETDAERQRQISQATTLAQTESRKASATTTTATESQAPQRAWTFRVIVMTILVSLGGLIFGYGGVGQIGGFLLMPDYRHRFAENFGDTRQGTIVSLLMVGGLVGSLIAGPIADKIGRKHSISIWALVYLIGSVIDSSSQRAWAQIVAGRAIEGLGIGGLSILVPMYQSECTPKEVRGTIISVYQLFITLGILLASAVNLGTKNLRGSASWRITIAIGMVWPLVLMIGVQFLDESPRWDARRDNSERAQLTLSKMCRSDEAAQRELREIHAAIEQEQAYPPISLSGLLNEPTILQRIGIGMVLQMMQQLTGINYFFYYGTELFSDLHVGDSYLTAVILSAVNFLATLVGLWIAKRFGHRVSLCFGGIWIGVWVMLYAFFGQYCIKRTCPIPSNSAGIAMVVFTCLAIVGFATTWGPLAWVVCTEIFPSRWKAVGMGAATATNWTFNFLIGFFTTAITNKVHYGLGWVFSGAILCGALFVFLFVHETAGKSLEAIDKEILEGTRPWDSTKGQ